MNRGGIFAGPNALGLGATGSSCQPDDATLVRKVQTYLKSHGAPNVHVDGQWQGCTASAFAKVMGHQWVTCDDLSKMGIQCSSDDCGPFGVLAAFSMASLNQCTDGSDGVSTGTGVQQQCPAGQCWNTITQMCGLCGIPGAVNADSGNVTPDSNTGACPSGSTGIPPLCLPTGGGSTQQQACPAGQTSIMGACLPNLMGGSSQNQYCPSGSVLTPAGCAGPAGVTTPMPCPEGQTSMLGMCVPNPFGGGSGQSGDIFGGLMASIGKIFGGDAQPGQPTGILGGLTTAIGKIFGAGVTCPSGSMYNPITQQCTGINGPVPAVIGQPGAPSSGFGNMGYVVVGLLAVGAAAAAYYVHKRNQDAEAFAPSDLDAMMMGGDPSMAGMDMMGLEGMDGMGMDAYGLGDPYGGYAFPNRRRGRKSRRRGGRRSRR